MDSCSVLCNKLPQTYYLETVQTYCLSVVTGQGSRFRLARFSAQVSQAEIRVSPEPRPSPHRLVVGRIQSHVLGGLRPSAWLTEATTIPCHVASPQHGRLLLQSQTDSTQIPRPSCNEVLGVGRERQATSGTCTGVQCSGTPSPAGAQPLARHVHGEVNGAQQPCTSTEGSEVGREF